MSQFFIEASGSPPGTPGIEFETGNTGGPVGPDGSNNLNVLGDSGSNLTVTGNPGTNTLTISRTNIANGTATTVGATTANVITFPLGAIAGVYTVDVKIAGFTHAGGTLGTGYAIVGAVRTTGAAATLMPSQAVDHFEEGALVAGFAVIAVSANNLLVQVTGTAGYTVSWTAQLEYVFGS